MKCYNYPEIEANGICVKCGKPMCEECLVDVGGKNHCRECLKNMDKLDETPMVVINNSGSSSSSSSSSSGPYEGWSCCCIIIVIAMFVGR